MDNNTQYILQYTREHNVFKNFEKYSAELLKLNTLGATNKIEIKELLKTELKNIIDKL